MPLQKNVKSHVLLDFQKKNVKYIFSNYVTDRPTDICTDTHFLESLQVRPVIRIKSLGYDVAVFFHGQDVAQPTVTKHWNAMQTNR